jgi:hypothetical protein
MGNPVPKNGMQTGIGRQHLEKGAGRRVPVEYNANIFAQALKHQTVTGELKELIVSIPD